MAYMFSSGHFSPLQFDAGPNYRWNIPVKTLDIVNLEALPIVQDLLKSMYEENDRRASSDGLLALLQALFDLTAHKQFSEIEWLLTNAEPPRLAPEFSVGILRATANYSAALPTWSIYRDKTRNDLERRGLDAGQILIGLM
jgi:hypothetical protein